MVPKTLRYTKDHEWVAIDGGTGTMGITDFAQQQLGDIVYVELPEVGRAVKAGETLGTIESVKAVSEIYSPIGGTIAEVNPALADAPEKLNQDPHGAAWICRIALSNPDEAGNLLDADAYEALIGK